MDIKKYIPSQLLVNEKIKLPDNFTKVKIDVGLSHNAPNSTKWLENESDLLILGFEPHPESFKILRGTTRRIKHPRVFMPLNQVDKTFFPINVALGNSEGIVDFYTTSKDLGTSSEYKPTQFEHTKISVPKFKLESFLDFFPWDQISKIDHLKIDVQGGDWDVIRGTTKYLDKIAYISYESTTHNQYEGVSEDIEEIDSLLVQKGFKYEKCMWDCDKVYFNTKFDSIKDSINFTLIS